MTKTEPKLGSELVEGDVVVGKERSYKVYKLATGTLELSPPNGKDRWGSILPDIYYDVEVKRDRRQRIEDALRHAGPDILGSPIYDTNYAALAIHIEAELEAEQ